MSRPRFELVDAVVVNDPTATLLGDLPAPPIRSGTGAVVTIQPTFAPGDYYVFHTVSWLKLLEEMAGRERALTPAAIERLLADAGEPASVVALGEQPERPAVVQKNDEIVGVWIGTQRTGRIGGIAAMVGAVAAMSYTVLAETLGRRGRHKEKARRRPPDAESADTAEPAPPNGHDEPEPEFVYANGDDEPEPESAPPNGHDEREPESVSANGDGDGALPPPDEDLLHRTPHLDLPDEPLPAKLKFTVAVYTDEEAAQLGEVVEGLSLAGRQETYHLYVWLLVSEHFKLDSDPVQPFRVDRAIPRSENVEYSVRVLDDPPAGTVPSISAVFLYEGRQAGKVEREVRVAGVAEKAPAPGRRRPEPPSVGVDRRPAQPDLTVIISRPGRGQSYQCAVRTRHLKKYKKPITAPWGFPSDAAGLVNQRMERFAQKEPSTIKRRARLVGAGVELYGDVPDPFRRVYRDLVAARKPIDSILIATEEAVFPWELVVPDDDDDRPLGVRHSVGRWTHPEQLPTKQRVRVHDGYVIAPDYPAEKRKLNHAEPEVTYVCTTFNCEKLNPPSVEGLNAALGSRPVSLLHFVCHGAAPDGKYAQSLYLVREAEDGQPEEEELDSEMLLGLPGVRQGVRTGTPLVFLNACEAGRLLPSLMGTAGLAKTFIAQGALGVIAPLWRVRDGLAADIAIAVYKAAVNGRNTPLAEIVRDVRARTYNEPEAEDSFAAYCFFGDPHTRLERVPGD
jgi:hypothetical protein